MVKNPMGWRSLKPQQEREVPGYVRWLVIGALVVAILILHHTDEKIG